MVMRPHVASTILNLVNHQVSEGCFTGNSQRTASSEFACNNQIHIFDRTTNRSSGTVETLTFTRVKKISVSLLTELNLNFSPQETPASKTLLKDQCCSLAIAESEKGSFNPALKAKR